MDGAAGALGVPYPAPDGAPDSGPWAGGADDRAAAAPGSGGGRRLPDDRLLAGRWRGAMPSAVRSSSTISLAIAYRSR